jgi:hypothetical protein
MSAGAVESMFSVFTHRPIFSLHAQPEGQSAVDAHSIWASPGTSRFDEHPVANARIAAR